MNCRQSRALFGPYWDDEVDQAEREMARAHFGSCAQCRREYEELARSLEWMSDLPRTEVSPGFAERVVAQARRRNPATDRVPGVTPRWIPVTAAAALLAVLAGMALQWTGVPLALHRPTGTALEQPVAIQPERVVHWHAGGARERFDRGQRQDPRQSLRPLGGRGVHPRPGHPSQGRAHTVVRGPTETPRTEQAVITFRDARAASAPSDARGTTGMVLISLLATARVVGTGRFRRSRPT
mgnify:CR=1 FL=1